SFFSVQSKTAIFFFLIAQLFDLIALLTVMVLLTVFQHHRAISGNQIILTSLIAGIMGIMTTEHGVEVFSAKSPWLIGFSTTTFIPVLVMVFSVIAILNLIFVYKKSYRKVDNPAQKDLLRLLFAGIIMSQLLGSFIPHLGFAFFPNIVEVGEFFLFPLFSFIKIIGLILIGYAFYRVGKRPWLMQQQQNHFLLVYNTAGIALYTKSFRKDISEENMSLFSGAFSAISTIIEETTKISESIKIIHFENKELHVFSRDTFICILMVDYSTKASFQAQKEFTLEFETKFHRQLTHFTGDVTKFKEADTLVKKYFF
ncbi:MAG: hypothetical protein KAR20_17440, partial [Candidatus Heimdallarchaeota archaeon]|nr:hypothetical protein [Candidatus Heimdallarchaeota archaeon]